MYKLAIALAETQLIYVSRAVHTTTKDLLWLPNSEPKRGWIKAWPRVKGAKFEQLQNSLNIFLNNFSKLPHEVHFSWTKSVEE